MVRCSRNRAESKYDAECINARDAVRRIEAKEEAERRAALEESSERKRRAASSLASMRRTASRALMHSASYLDSARFLLHRTIAASSRIGLSTNSSAVRGGGSLAQAPRSRRPQSSSIDCLKIIRCQP